MLLLGEAPSLLGIDGLAKMSNARDNAIFLSDPAEVVAAKVRCMYTDPQRGRADIPGRVEGNPASSITRPSTATVPRSRT